MVAVITISSVDLITMENIFENSADLMKIFDFVWKVRDVGRRGGFYRLEGFLKIFLF